MLDQLMNLVRDSAQQTIANNPEVSDDQKESIIQEATASIKETLQNELTGGGAQNVLQLLGKGSNAPSQTEASTIDTASTDVGTDAGLNAGPAAGSNVVTNDETNAATGAAPNIGTSAGPSIEANAGSNAAGTNVANNSIVQKIKGNFIGRIMQKLGISNSTATGIASSLIPLVISKLIHKINDPSDSTFNLQTIISSLTEGKMNLSNLAGEAGGDLLGKAKGIFGKK